MKTQIIDNQKAFELEDKVSIAAKKVKESKENLGMLTKAIDNLLEFFAQYMS
jgi:hypothetical protein